MTSPSLTCAFGGGGERERDRETERQRDRETERQTDRETDRQTERETDRQTDRQTETVKGFPNSPFFNLRVFATVANTH